ncbi:TPA: hypothetical protein ACG53V_004471, partial [Escherichia coli]
MHSIPEAGQECFTKVVAMLTRREWKRGQDIFVIEIAIISYSLKIFLIFIYSSWLLFFGVWLCCYKLNYS